MKTKLLAYDELGDDSLNQWMIDLLKGRGFQVICHGLRHDDGYCNKLYGWEVYLIKKSNIFYHSANNLYTCLKEILEDCKIELTKCLLCERHDCSGGCYKD